MPQAPSAAPGEEDWALISKAKAAHNGERFSRLFDGDTEGYPSDSEADLALCRILAFWAQKDPVRIERLFNLSVLGQRDKWRDRADYRQRTITAALQDQKESSRGQAAPPPEIGQGPTRRPTTPTAWHASS